jgi:FMN phosphatase YigB (HAD superfamily)
MNDDDYVSKINVNDYDLFIFDYDATLYILDTDAFKQESYKNRLYDFLYNLKQQGKKLSIASHNVSVHQCIKNATHLNEFFENEFIFGEYPINKSFLVSAIIHKSNCKKEKTIFFDDLLTNILHVQEYGVKSVLIDPYMGIDFEQFD